MSKTVVLGTTNHQDYIQYYKYVVKAWNNLGWNTLTFHINPNNVTIKETPKNKVIEIQTNTYSETMASQVSRLFGHHYIDNPDDMIMTSDIDMIPLSDYWCPTSNKINCYGYDLTNYTQYPICYIATNKRLWQQLIPEKNIEDLLNQYKCASSKNFNEYWYTDQLIITKRIKQYASITIEINRTFNCFGLAYGRIDRALWNATYHNNDTKIDAHMPRPYDEMSCKNLLTKYHGLLT